MGMGAGNTASMGASVFLAWAESKPLVKGIKRIVKRAINITQFFKLRIFFSPSLS
jgi:hypothetical protein